MDDEPRERQVHQPDEGAEEDEGAKEEAEEAVPGRTTILVLSVTTFLVCVGGTVLGDSLTGSDTISSLLESPRLTFRDLTAGVLLTLPMLLFLWLEHHARWPWLRELWELPVELLGPLLRRATLPELAFIAVLAGVGEELFFRGFLQGWLVNHGLLIGLIVPNLLFGLLHWISPAYAACTFCIGLYFSSMLAFVGMIELPALMIAHSLYDLIALSFLVREVRKTKTG